MTTGNFFSIFPQIVLEAPWKQLQPFSICQLQGLASPEKLQKRPSPSHRWEEGRNTSITREEREVGGSATSAFKQNKQKVNQKGFSPNIYKTQAWAMTVVESSGWPWNSSQSWRYLWEPGAVSSLVHGPAGQTPAWVSQVIQVSSQHFPFGVLSSPALLLS